MYNLVSAMGKSKTYNGRWANLNIADVPMIQLYQSYHQVFAVVTSSFAPTVKLTLDLDLVKPTYVDSSLTFSQFLIANGNTTLPTSTDLYELNTKYVRYSDATRAQYKTMLVGPDGHLDSSEPVHNRQWLSLKRSTVDYPNFDYVLMQKSCLVTVNGFIHLADTDNTQLLVIDGAKSANISHLNQIGLISFREIGSLEFLPITEAMVHRRYTNTPLSRNLYLNIGTPKPDKTAMLVLGGYLHALDEKTFRRESDNIFSIDFQNYPLLDRYFESKQFIDLSSLGLESDPNKDETISSQELYSDEVLTKYVTLSQSFLVFIDTVNLFAEKQSLRRSNLPAKFTSYVEPLWPLVIGTGLIGDYWRVKEDGQWALSVNLNWQCNYDFNTTPTTNWGNVNDACEPENPLDIGRGHFLKIGSDIRKIVGA